MVQGRFNLGCLYPYRKFVVVIIGEQQLCLFIPERGTGKLVIHIPDLDSHLFDVQQGVVAFLAGNVSGYAVAEFAVAIITER